ncbi:MAG: LCP family protein [Thermomicrobiales bacterium]|nr:LCP family protein [Thermomicrobiales bacterium]MCO5227147.1 LCP family protein [Thermomicrobiales bacterium]
MQSPCPQCGARVELSDAFCPECGTSLTAAAGGTMAMPVVQPLAMPPAYPPTTHRRRRRRPWYKKKRFMIPLTLILILGMVGGASAWYVNQRYGNFQEISTPEPESAAAQALTEPTAVVTPTSDGTLTVLMMGVDAREGEQIDIGVRPDSLSVLHINPAAKTCRVVSIPRDTRTELPGYGQSKINHALSVGGIPYQQLVVQNTLGIQIDHFALVDFGGVVGAVDALGGVDVNNQTAFEIEGVTFPVGPQHLDGQQALLYSRFRYDSEGDFGRQRRQQEVIQAMLKKANNLDAARAIPSLLSSIEGHFKTDLSITQLVSMAGKYRDYCTADKVETDGLDGSVANDFDELMGQELSFVHVSQDEIDAKVRWLLGE